MPLTQCGASCATYRQSCLHPPSQRLALHSLQSDRGPSEVARSRAIAQKYGWGSDIPQGLPVSIFSPLADASEPHRAQMQPAPPIEGPQELKRGPGLGAREGLCPEEPSPVRLLGPEGLGLGLGVASQHVSHCGLYIGPGVPPGPHHMLPVILCTSETRLSQIQGARVPGAVPRASSLDQLHTLDTDLHSLAQIRGPCPTKRRLLPAGEAPDVSSEEEGPAFWRCQGTLGHSTATNCSDAQTTPSGATCCLGPRSPVLDPTD
ncbi:Protein FAM214B [Plecturocebus cupreus]